MTDKYTIILNVILLIANLIVFILFMVFYFRMKNLSKNYNHDQSDINEQLNQDNIKESDIIALKKWNKSIRPRFISNIFFNLTLLGPYLNLIYKISTGEFDKLIISALLTLPTVALIPLTWVSYYNQMKKYKIDTENLNKEIEKLKEIK